MESSTKPSPPSVSMDQQTTGEACQIFLFGDLTTSFEVELRQLIHVRDNPTLAVFFDQVGFALREEIGKLPTCQQDLFPRFTKLVDLVSRANGTQAAPVLSFCLLSVCQIGQLIRYFGNGSREYPKPSNTFGLGLCTGSFAAAAFSVARSLSELVPIGVEAVLVAFRTALRSLSARSDVTASTPSSHQSWSAIVNVQEDEATRSMESYASEKGLPRHLQPYISATAPSNVTISGIPDVLQDFLASGSHKVHQLAIESPYHAQHLFGTLDVEQALGQFRDASLESRKPRIPILSPVDGKIIPVTDYKSMLRHAVTTTLCEQVQWKRILESTTEVLSLLKFEQCTIHAVHSNAASLLSSAITRGSKLEVATDVLSSANSSAPKPATSNGRFDQSKIAIVGYSGRFPDSDSNEEFWDLLRAGKDVHRTIPADRFDWKTHFDASGKTKNTSRVQYGCFIKEPGLFDPRFFNISPREAENTDPAQRLAITTTYEALEMSGIVPNRTPSTQQDRIGVFFGTTSDDWREVNSGQNIDTYFIPGGNRAFVPGRISYFFRFSGPSLSVDTACSSSFAAIQIACSNLWRGECDTAVAGGTNVLTNPDNFAGLDRGHFLSTTGNCNAFDDEASGYCRADAVGSVILKRLEDAEADNDPIFGVIAGSFTNHCGQTESITRPHRGDQVAVFNRILQHANVDPLDIGYVEMHGTGTQAGDATEMNSVLSVFVPEDKKRHRFPNHPLYIGSAKANIGHAESASGVSSLIKVLMMMKHDEIPPHCGIKNRINHNYPLDLKERNVNIALEVTPWKRSTTTNGKRSVFLNNFSAAGGNTAILLEDAPVLAAASEDIDARISHLVTVSAKCAKSLAGNIDALIRYMELNPETSVSQLSYTTTARRMHHNYRAMVSGSSLGAIRNAFKEVASGPAIKPIPNKVKMPKIAFVFTGQGTLYISIGRRLFENLALFKSDILRYDSIAQRHGFQSFLPMVDGSAADMGDDETLISQLAITCVQMAISNLWISLGIRPSFTTGHSLGEYAAFHAAGVLTASDVIYLVGSRAQLLTTHCQRGTHTMLAIKAALSDIEPLLAGTGCEIACTNHLTSNVVSGTNEQISHLTTILQSNGINGVKLNVPYALHSAQVDPILKEMEAKARNVQFHAPSIPYVSPLLAQVVTTGGTLNASYLTRACRSTVDFQGALEAAEASSLVDATTIWLEIGTHPACSGMVKTTLGSQMRTLPSLRENVDALEVMASSLQTLYLAGMTIDWNEWHRDFKSSHKVLQLPRYSWDLKNYWIMYKNDFCLTKGDAMMPKLQLEPAPTPASVQNFEYLSPSVQRILEEEVASDMSTLLAESDIQDPRLASVIQGHRVNGVALCPSSLYADIAMTIANRMLKSAGASGNNVGIDVGTMKVDKSLIAQPDAVSQLLRISASADWSTNNITMAFYSVNADGKKLLDHATCEVKTTSSQTWQDEWKRSAYLIQSRISALEKGVNEGESHKMKRGMVYKLFGTLVDYEQQYQGIEHVILDSTALEAAANVSFQVDEQGYFMNPCWIDSLGHLAGFIMNGNETLPKSQVYINHGWDRMRCASKFSKGETYQTYNKMQLLNGTLYAGDTYIMKDGEIVAIFEGVKFQGLPRRVLDTLLPAKSGPKAQNITPKASPSTTTAKNQAKSDMVVERRPQKMAPPKTLPIVDQRPVKQVSGIIPRVMAIICGEVGIDASELRPENEFSDFGLDSLLALTISGRIREEVGIDIPSTLFAEYPTVKEFQNFIDDGAAAAPSVASSSASSSSDDKTETSTSTPETTECPTPVASDSSEKFREILRMTIAEETGTPTEEMNPSALLSELGVDSLLALTAMGKLKEALDIDLPQSLFTDSDTLFELEKALGLIIKDARGPVGPDPAVFNKVTTALPPHATSILLQGNPKTANKKLWLFPDGSGSATSYASVASISRDVAVYGLNCPWLKCPDDMRCTLEELTTKYIVEIQKRQPHGPYYLGGWSAGGICAYEAVQQLKLQGEETASLILIDSPNPIGLENPPERMYFFFETLGIFGEQGKAPPPWLRKHFAAFIRLLDDYKVKPMAGKLNTHMLYARDGICKLPSDPRPETRPDDPREMLWLLNNRTDFSGSGWLKLVGKENLTVDVLSDVNHFTMMDVGKDLSAFLKRSMY